MTRSAEEEASPEELTPGERVGPFRVMRLLARGGMGEVFVARDVRLGRKVALKFLSTRDTEARQRVLQEARATARLSHPHVVSVYSVGQHRGRPYMALEYIEGPTLRQRFAEERAGLREALRIALAIAEALREAHRSELVHGDLKPDNVIIPPDGRLRVVDLGLAQLLDGKELAKGSGSHTVGGTPVYMAPEQWRGDPLTGATDVWALGLLLAELLSGRRALGWATDVVQLSNFMQSPAPVPPLAADVAPAAVRELVAACLHKDPLLRPSAADVVTALEAVLAPSAPRLPAEDQSPFTGLATFGEADAAFFFGRDGEIAAFLERLRDEPLLPVIGASGAGKSSFVQAGVLPRLRERGNWEVLQLRPGARPFHTLARLLLARDKGLLHDAQETVPESANHPRDQLPASRDELDLERLIAALRGSSGRLGAGLRELAAERKSKVLLFVDQLEELFTLVDDEAERRELVRALVAAADDPREPVRVCFTIRDDYFTRLTELTEQREALRRVTVLHTPRLEALEDILRQPLARVGYAWEDEGLVTEMIAAIAGERAGLPLLSFAARALWDARDRERRVLTRAAFTSMGGVAGALAHHADGVLAGLSTHETHLARSLLLRLVTADGTRRVLRRQEALAALGPEGETVLARLIAARLIAVSRAEDAADDEHAELELAHESLIHRWRRLAQWIAEGREELVFLADLRQAATVWQKRGARPEEAWDAEALREAERTMARLGVQPSGPAAELLAASRRRVRQAARRRRIVLTSGMLALGLIATTASVVAVVMARQRQQVARERNTAEDRRAQAQLEAARTAYLTRDLVSARALLRAALETRDTIPARALWLQLRDDPVLWRRTIAAPFNQVSYSPDGQLLATGATDGLVYLFDAVTGVPRTLRGHADRVDAVVFAPDGRTLASVALNGEIGLWRADGTPIKLWRGHEQTVVAPVRYLAGGRRIVTASQSGDAVVWDADSGAPVARWSVGEAVTGLAARPDGGVTLGTASGKVASFRADGTALESFAAHADEVRGLAWTADGKRLVTGGFDRAVRLWDGAQKLAELPTASGVRVVALGRDDQAIAAATTRGMIYVWDAATGKEERRFTGHQDTVRGLAFSPDGMGLATAGADRVIQIWNLAAPATTRGLPSHDTEVNIVAFSGDGTRLVSTGREKRLRVWDVATGEVQRIAHGETTTLVNRLTPSSDGKTILGIDYMSARLWNLETGAEISAFHEKRPILTSAYTARERATAFSDGEGSVRIWDLAYDREEKRFPITQGAIEQTRMSPDGRWLAVAVTENPRVFLYDTSSGRLHGTLEGHTGLVETLSFSGDSTRLATGARDRTVRLWEVAGLTGRVIVTRYTEINTVEIFPDGRRVVVADQDGGLAVYDDQGALRAATRGQGVPVKSVRQGTAIWTIAVASDGERIASCGADTTVRLWDAALRPLWRGPALVPRTPELLSQRGWRLLAGGASLLGAKLRQRITTEATLAAFDPAAASACLITFGGEVERWDVAGDRLVFTARLHAGLDDVVVLGDDACVVLDGGKALRLASDGTHEVAAAEAIYADERGALVASGDTVIPVGPDGVRAPPVAAGRGGITALLRDGDGILVGRSSGEIERLGRAPFESRPSGAILAMAVGPAGTVIAGHVDGTVSLWDGAAGRQLSTTRLHGRVLHVVVAAARVYAATDLGDLYATDLAGLAEPACDVLREVWRSIPIVWEGDGFVRRAPPAGHVCAAP